MKKLAFLFTVGLLSTSPVWAMPANGADLSPDPGVELFLENYATIPETCTIRIQGTYDGKQIDVTVTVQADNCARAAGELLKSFAKK